MEQLKLKLLLLTNIYPPQELGGYGRSMAEFVWGLHKLGHNFQVICSDAPYLGLGECTGPSGETIHRKLLLQGSYKGGVQKVEDQSLCRKITDQNSREIETIWQIEGPFEGVIVGNLDLLGVGLLECLLQKSVSILHHIGFVNPPFQKHQQPKALKYQFVAASKAVANSLQSAGLKNPNGKEIAIVYPGIRADLFGEIATGRSLPEPLNGQYSQKNLGSIHLPIKICYAGLLMGSKGAHTLIQALALLSGKGYAVQGYLAGKSYQVNYQKELESILIKHNLDQVVFTGELSRASLARLFRLHHICVFPSIYPEAFGIVAAEAMASGTALVSSGVGGSAEIFEDQKSGLLFKANDADDLAAKLEFLCQNPVELRRIARNGEVRARTQFDVLESAKKLEKLILQT